MKAPEAIVDLVEHFDRSREAYESDGYNETQLRREFVDPFFKVLGWDVDNTAGYAEVYKDVIHEDAIKVGGATKAPDYSFRVGGMRKFFVETKRPSINISDDPSPSYQLRRYAWSAKLALSILTNFEELAVYDCTVKPKVTDKASTARILQFNYRRFEKTWEDISSIFSKDAVLKGSFDRYAATASRKKGTAGVDTAFLSDIDAWRQSLAQNIALRNPKLTQRELNFAVGKTIDRIIFLRICEDRGIEPNAQLMALQNGANVYQRLIQIYYNADDKYNSGLFHFQKEKDRYEPPDDLTLNLTIDDKPLKDIFKSLYYPESPYEFSVLPADILGQIYEQFLGKVIYLTAGHRAKVEEKPEVKKAGGVYYTPTYIVDYIVKNTVGKLLEGKKPGPRGNASNLRILDPACGSGSFLIGAYQYLMDWHNDQYIADGPEKWAKGRNPALYQVVRGEWRLTTAERKRILLNNIYGVDIDPQAVEVTKLSLLLKVLEGENEETINASLRLFHERALPDLGNNIKCGNSLIDPDFYDNQQLGFFDDEERYRVNVFDWEKEFPEVFNIGGFDAVIGNPPYGFHQIHSDQSKAYFKKNYVASQGSFEHYFLFYEASLNLIKKSGLHGFIVPVTWLTIPSAHNLRKFILDKFGILEICWLPELVFTNAQVNTLVSIISLSPASNVRIKIYDSLGFKQPPKIEFIAKQSRFIESNYFIGIFERELDSKLLQKIVKKAVHLETMARPCSGYNPYEVGKGERPEGGLQNKNTVETKPYHSTRKEGATWKPEIVGRDLGRYSVNVTGTRWIKYGPWLAAPRDPNNFEGKRILIQEITGGKGRRIIAGYYDGELYHSRDVIPVKCDNSEVSPLYILGIVNSRLITWYHHKRSPKSQKSLFPKVLVSDVAKLPVHIITFSDPADKARHDRMVALVEQMLSLNKKLAIAKTEHDKTTLQRQIEATDHLIDKLVYELYGLTDEEIGIVEGNG
jgi:type I restriction-modification system DNA methylase subunit